MTPPVNTPLSMILQDGTSATGIYASLADVIRRSGAVYSSNDHNAHKLNDLRWFRKQASGHYVLTDAPRSWVQPNDLTAHGTDPVMIAREIARAAQRPNTKPSSAVTCMTAWLSPPSKLPLPSWLP